MTRPLRTLTLLSLLPLALCPLALSRAGAQPAPPLSYQGPVPAAASVRQVRLAWTLAVDRATSGDPAALVAGSRALIKVGGALQARDLATGKLVWQVTNPGRLLAAHSAGVLTEYAGTLISRRPSDGRVMWQTPLSGVRDVRAQGDTLYVTAGRGALALNAATGKVRWRYADSELTAFGGSAMGVVWWRVSKGEPHFPAVVALDAGTGRRLYDLHSTLGPLAVQGDLALFKDFGARGPDDRAVWQWVELRSGRTARTVTVQADFRCPDSQMSQHSDDGFYAAGFFYLNDRCGARLNQFAAGPGPENDKKPQPALRTFRTPDDGRYRLGPVGEFLLFEGRSGELRLIPAAGRSGVNMNGVEMPTGTGLALPGAGPVSRLDAVGDVVYVGRVGGDFLAYDVARKKALYAARLPWRGFGPTLRSGSYAVLTGPGAVAVVRETP